MPDEPRSSTMGVGESRSFTKGLDESRSFTKGLDESGNYRYFFRVSYRLHEIASLRQAQGKLFAPRNNKGEIVVICVFSL